MITKKRVNFSLNTETEQMIKGLAKEKCISMSELIRRAVEFYKFNCK